MQTDSTSNTDFSNWLFSWLSPIVLVAILTLLFFIFKERIFRRNTRPRLNDCWLNDGSTRTLSFIIANNRNYSISPLSFYYRIFYLGFIPSKKFYFNWDYPINLENSSVKKTTIEKEQKFIIPLANDELAAKRKYKIYVKTSGGLCKAIPRPWLRDYVEDLEKKSKSRK